MSNYLIIYHNRRDVKKLFEDYDFIKPGNDDNIIYEEMKNYKLDKFKYDINGTDDESVPLLKFRYGEFTINSKVLQENIKNKEVIMMILDKKSRYIEYEITNIYKIKTIVLDQAIMALHIFCTCLELIQLQKFKSINIINNDEQF